MGIKFTDLRSCGTPVSTMKLTVHVYLHERRIKSEIMKTESFSYPHNLYRAKGLSMFPYFKHITMLSKFFIYQVMHQSVNKKL